MYKLIVIASCLFVSIALFPQKYHPTVFSHQDSLKGYLFPERACYDVHFYELDLEINIDERVIGGRVNIHFNTLNDFDRMQINLAKTMNINNIKYEGRKLAYKRSGDAVFVEMGKTLLKGQPGILSVLYSGHPKRAVRAPWDGGFVWDRDLNNRDWVGVACESEGASIWWPCKDHFTDEPDSLLMHFTVPKGLIAVGNGKLIKKQDINDDRTRFSWKVVNPINLYNVTLNIADYAHFSDTYTGTGGQELSLDYYVLKQNLEKAQKHFKGVEPTLACFEKYFGKYPFYEDGYKLVETPYLGMEHQSAIAYGNHYLPGYLGYDPSGLGFDYIIVHETGHEWFGNSITAEDHAELWIHESFTTYAEAVYVEYYSDYQNAIKYLNSQKIMITNEYPLVGPKGVYYDISENDSDIYYKGSWLLHTLRSVVDNDELWWYIIKSFAENNLKSILTTEDVIEHFNRESKMDLTAVFKQYLYHPSIPVFEYELQKEGKNWILKYRWKVDEAGFNMPLDIAISKKETKRLIPAIEWQVMRINKLKAGEIKIDLNKFYVNVERIK